MPKAKRKVIAKRKVVAKPKPPKKTSAKVRSRSETKAKVKAKAAEANKSPLFFWKETESEGGFLSPWYKSPFQIEGVTYESAGQCILAQKAQAFGDKVYTLLTAN
jgi:predicted NAD-dependent protein-ADP-ribosyltransferase YbiA (DUF1768 family)